MLKRGSQRRVRQLPRHSSTGSRRGQMRREANRLILRISVQLPFLVCTQTCCRSANHTRLARTAQRTALRRNDPQWSSSRTLQDSYSRRSTPTSSKSATCLRRTTRTFHFGQTRCTNNRRTILCTHPHCTPCIQPLGSERRCCPHSTPELRTAGQ